MSTRSVGGLHSPRRGSLVVDLPRSDQALRVCRQHASEAKEGAPFARWAQVEAVLASYVASTIYAEAESRLRDITAQRVAHKVNDDRIASFGRIASERLIRSIRVAELSGTLGHFDSRCKAHFAKGLTSKQKSDWDSLIGARHGVAHESSGATDGLTLGDVEGYYNSVYEVIDLYANSLYVES